MGVGPGGLGYGLLSRWESPRVGSIPASARLLLSWFSWFSRFSRFSWFSWFSLFSGWGGGRRFRLRPAKPMGSPRVGSIPASARLVCFLGFLGFPCFRGGVGGGGLGYGLLSRWGHPAWVRFPLLAILSCALAVLTFRATRAVVGCYIWSRPFGNAHAGSRTRVTSMGGLYDTATLHALMSQKHNSWSTTSSEKI